ncbi:hypothetical protein VTP01DRAFT_5320 [Rhizomucor pusillus]|uniref:uncharacterized protein n=1 Tax=Rhizomucor pusillus TaxID=4840 RepID=UPI00374484F2
MTPGHNRERCSEKNLKTEVADEWNQVEDSEDEHDSDFIPDEGESDNDNFDADSVTSEDECSPETPLNAPSPLSKKRSSSDDDDVEKLDTKKQRVDDAEAELQRKARVEAIWAEMNRKDQDNKKPGVVKSVVEEKKPLNDISSSENRPSIEEKPEKQSATAPVKKKSHIVRPKSTLSALVSHYNIKVPKMNTLEKSRLDWQGYVEREGIRDELKYKNKDGYMEKVAFLQRVDDRRLTQLKAGQRASRKN